ncbi:UDP-rhamnose:rhamnosyltransferase [Actinidia chinensis var. chinensis]|uniref:UDP-rhamnose:rhamnosyltransferase n=1 Tax=Actinidia chinensis var. chinensis TaxID=1590841 RepID=A0A2R6Q7Y0_ACTCC|nr:UDP-rhamnose:rhamnosyltransferase [Actinidia chinensis var. chinensis]
MESESSTTTTTHVVLLPFVAFGHLMPFHQLAIALAKSGVRVSYVSTPRNIERLPKPSHNLSHLLNFVSLPLPILDSHPLPDSAEATVDVPLEEIPYLTKAFDLLKQPFERFVSEKKPNWVIIDFIPHWGADVARNCGVPVMSFSAFSAATKVFFGPPEFLAGEGQKRARSTPESLTSPPPWVTFPSEVAFRRFDAAGVLFGFYGMNASEKSASERVARSIEASQAVAIRSCREIEGEYLSLFAELIGKPVIPVGLLPPEKPERREITDKSWGEIFDWLDQQPPKSVVFAGFGSECKLSKEQIYEIAYGLEASNLPFLWALRKPSWAIDDSDALPPGFSQRTSNKHKVCIGWAPQMEILSHPSIGGSLFHSGWGSVIETLQFGHVLVVLPLFGDQALNARLLVEKGLAIEVERGEDGSFSRDDIAESLRQAMVSEKGEGMRARLREAAAVASDRKLHDHYVDEFVELLKKGVGKLNQ